MRRPLGLDYGADAAVLGLGAGGGGRRGRPMVVRAVPVRAVPVRQEGAVGMPVPVPVLVVLVWMWVRGRVVVVVVVVGRWVLVTVGAVVRVWRGRRALGVVWGLRGHMALGWGFAPLATEQGP